MDFIVKEEGSAGQGLVNTSATYYLFRRRDANHDEGFKRSDLSQPLACLLQAACKNLHPFFK